MPKDNLISLKMTDEKVGQVRSSVTSLEELLKPDLVALSPSQKKDMIKVGNRMLPFVNKTLQYIGTNPEFVPGYMMDVEEFRTDVNAANVLSEFHVKLSQIVDLLNDTMMLTGSEAYTAALHYYNAVKQGAKAGTPGAQVIFDDLKVFFARTSKATETPAETA